MKHATLSFFLLFVLGAKAQLTQFWNTNVQLNPSLLALDYNHSAYGSTNFSSFKTSPGWPQGNKNFDNFNFISADYSTYLNKINSGLGLIYSSVSAHGYTFGSNIKLAYNYQMVLSRKGVLSVGGSIGSMNSKRSFSNSSFQNDTVLRGQTWQGDIGVTIKFDRFRLGFGYQNIGKIDNVSYGMFPEKTWNVYSEYRFGKMDGFQFKPRMLATKAQGDLMLYTQGQLGFQNRYFVGLGVVFSDGSMDVININVECFLLDKVKLSYTLNRKKYNNYNSSTPYYFKLTHEIGFGLNFGNRNTKKPEQL